MAARELEAGGTVSPASPSFPFAHLPIIFFGSFQEESSFVRKPLSRLLTPPDHPALSRPHPHLFRELSAACTVDTMGGISRVLVLRQEKSGLPKLDLLSIHRLELSEWDDGVGGKLVMPVWALGSSRTPNHGLYGRLL